jgi:hypothetical protein
MILEVSPKKETRLVLLLPLLLFPKVPLAAHVLVGQLRVTHVLLAEGSPFDQFNNHLRQPGQLNILMVAKVVS